MRERERKKEKETGGGEASSKLWFSHVLQLPRPSQLCQTVLVLDSTSFLVGFHPIIRDFSFFDANISAAMIEIVGMPVFYSQRGS